MFLLKEGNARIDHCEGGCQNRVTWRPAESIIKCGEYLGYGAVELWVTHCCSNDKSSNKGKFQNLNENFTFYFKDVETCGCPGWNCGGELHVRGGSKILQRGEGHQLPKWVCLPIICKFFTENCRKKWKTLDCEGASLLPPLDPSIACNSIYKMWLQWEPLKLQLGPQMELCIFKNQGLEIIEALTHKNVKIENHWEQHVVRSSYNFGYGL